MEDKKKKIDLHFILKQGRHLICFVLVVIFVFCYSINALASNETYVKFYDIYPDYTQEVISSNPVLNYQSIKQNYYNNGGDPTKLIGYTDSLICNNFFKYMGDSYITNIKNNIRNMNMYNTLDYSGATYNFRNAYTFLTLNNDSTFVNRGVRCFSDSPIYLVDGKLFSESAITLVYWNNNTFNNGNETVVLVSTPSSDGYYWYNLSGNTYIYNNISAIYFSDMNIYFSSSDGSSGFTSGNFNPSNVDSYFNFNFLKTGGYITNDSDPSVNIDNFAEYAKSRMNFSMNSYYTGGKLLNSAKHRVTINWPDVVRQNPENFYLKVEYTGKYKDDSLASTITFTRSLLHGQRYRLIPITTIMSNNNGQLPSSFSIDVGLGSLVDANNRSMFQYFLDSVSAFSGVSDPTSNNIWMNFLNTVGEAVYNFLYGEDDDLPLAQLARDIDSYIDVMEIEGYVSIMYDKDSTNYITGANHSKFNFKNGNSETLGTDNTINQYPEENQSEYQLPSSQNGNNQVTNQNAPVAYGGVVQFENNVNAMIEYLFNIDASDYLNIVGNTHSAIQETFNTLTNTSQNGAWAIMEQSYALIPDEIWGWIKSAVAVILGGSIISWVLYFRVKKG